MKPIKRSQRNIYEEKIMKGVPIKKRIEIIHHGNDIYQREYYNETDYFDTWIDIIAIYRLRIFLDAYDKYHNPECLNRISETEKLFNIVDYSLLWNDINALSDEDISVFKIQNNWYSYNNKDGSLATFIDENGQEKYGYEYEDPWDPFYQ